MPSDELAAVLGITAQELAVEIDAVRRRLGTHGPAGFCRIAIEQGLLEVERRHLAETCTLSAADTLCGSGGRALSHDEMRQKVSHCYPPTSGPLSALSRLDVQILCGLALDLGSEELGEILGVSRHSVVAHAHAVCQRLGVQGSAGLCRLAVEHGLLDIAAIEREPDTTERILRAIAPLLATVAARVLVVDDDPTIVQLLAKLLRNDGYDVHCAADGLEALSQVERMRPQIVISDVQMPHCDGLSLLKKLKQMAVPPKVLMISGCGDPAVEQQALKLGADEYLTKPVLPSRLRSSVSRQLLASMIVEEDAEPIACFDDSMLFKDLRNAPKC
jgi:CheY-like chemotaxis protein